MFPTAYTCAIHKMKEMIKSMMKKISFAAIVCALAMFIAAPLAHATTVTEVQAMIASLITKTEGVAITGKSAETGSHRLAW